MTLTEAHLAEKIADLRGCLKGETTPTFHRTVLTNSNGYCRRKEERIDK
jgi:hypothetical protein